MYVLIVEIGKAYRYCRFEINFKVEVLSIVDEKTCEIKYLKILNKSKISKEDIPDSILIGIKKDIKNGFTAKLSKTFLQKW
jgi:hypothetical protein